MASFVVSYACMRFPKEAETNPAVKAQRAPAASFDDKIDDHADRMLDEGREVFRYDTFGSEAFWGDKLRLHEAIAGEQQGGIGPGLVM
jgi:hypothetical protein